jgi:type I pantothenate kinase
MTRAFLQRREIAMDAAGDPAWPQAGYTAFDREAWAQLRSSVPMTLGEPELRALRGAGDPTTLPEVEAIYLPLTRLISLHVEAARVTARVTDDFLGRLPERRPYVIAIAGSVAVGKSTAARLLTSLLACSPDHPAVELVTSDGFLHPNARLQEAGLMGRKGFPESYDLRRMIKFLAELRGTGRGWAPVYSHDAYDIVPGAVQKVEDPDILIFEGLNVLQVWPASRASTAMRRRRRLGPWRP